MRFPTQTRESPHFRASTRAIVKHFWSVLTACSNFTRPARVAQDGHASDRYGHLFHAAITALSWPRGREVLARLGAHCGQGRPRCRIVL